MRTACGLGLALVLAAASGCGGAGTGGGSESAAPILYDEGTEDFPSYLVLMDRQVPGLVTFDLGFLNGDHHAWSLAAGGVAVPSTPDPYSFLLELHDGDDGPFGTEPPDPVSLLARFWDLQAVSLRHATVGQDLQGVARLSLDPPIGPGELFVLSGFGVHTDGSNHHLRVLRVEPFPALGYVEVEYADDSPGDDLYSASVAYAIIPADHGPGSTLRPAFDGPYTETFRFAGRTTTAPRRSGYPVLQGFSLRFRNGDRHLERVELDLGWPDVIFATLRDGDVDPKDDEVDATVHYLLMTP